MMSTQLTPTETISPAIQAKLQVTLALLKALQWAAWFALVNNLCAIVMALLVPSFTLKALALGVVSVSMAVLYAVIRTRIDAALFAQWQSISPTALDAALQAIHPTHQAGKTLIQRLDGSLKHFKRGLWMLGLQFLLLLAMTVLI